MTLQDAFGLIGRGQTLRVPQDGGQAWFTAFIPLGHATAPCPRRLAEEIVRHPSIFHMTEFRTGDRLGWRDLGWPAGNDYYCMVQ